MSGNKMSSGTEALRWKSSYQWLSILFNEEKYQSLSREAKLFYCILAGQEVQSDGNGQYILYDSHCFSQMLAASVASLDQWRKELEDVDLIRFISGEEKKIYVRTFTPGYIESVTGMALAMERIKVNISYENLISEHYDRGTIDELVALIAEMIYIPRKTVCISGVAYPYEIVRDRFLKIKGEHIRYILYCLENNAGKIRKVGPYLLACLFNAPNTYYSFLGSERKHLFDEANKES